MKFRLARFLRGLADTLDPPASIPDGMIAVQRVGDGVTVFLPISEDEAMVLSHLAFVAKGKNQE